MQRQQARAEQLLQQEQENKRRQEAEAAAARAVAMEREQYMTMKEARLAAEEDAKRQKELEAECKRQAEALRKEQEQIEAERIKMEKQGKTVQAKKEKEIYLSMQQVRQLQKKKAQEEEARMDKIYQEQEKQAKKAEEEQRQAVLKARQLAQASTESALQLLEQTVAKSPSRHAMPLPVPPQAAQGEAPSPIVRTPSTLSRGATLTGKAAGMVGMRPDRPTSEKDVIQWWRSEENPRGVGRDARGRLHPWFHGIISREDSERLLAGQGNGAFLVRVSARIWGYTISFQEAGKCKHFLVDVVDGQYTVFSASSRAHSDLNTLVAFHCTFPEKSCSPFLLFFFVFFFCFPSSCSSLSLFLFSSLPFCSPFFHL